MLYNAEDELKSLINKNKSQEIPIKHLRPAIEMITKSMNTLFNQSGLKLQLSLKEYLSSIIKSDTTSYSYESVSEKLKLKDSDSKKSSETGEFSSPELLKLVQGDTDFYKTSFPDVFKDKEKMFDEGYINKVKEILVGYIQKIVEQLESEKDKLFLRDPAYWKAKAEMENIQKHLTQEKLSEKEEEYLRKEETPEEEEEEEESEDEEDEYFHSNTFQ